tara:strand:- start:148 stop:351 length:204 start_codon:yes stop_codon:yes gene_type:complete
VCFGVLQGPDLTKVVLSGFSPAELNPPLVAGSFLEIYPKSGPGYTKKAPPTYVAVPILQALHINVEG